MLKQAFGQEKELQEEIVPLSNIFSNRLDEFVNSSNENDVISYHLNRNAMSSQLPAIGRGKIAGQSELKDGIEDTNNNTSDVSFFFSGISIYN